MNPNDPRPASDGVAEDWLARLMAPDCTSAERAAFEDWLAESPRHVEAYLQTECAHALAAELADDPLLRAAARAARRERPRGGAWKTLLPLALAAGVAAVAVFVKSGGPGAPAPAPQAYATAIGEQRTVVLADGTRLALDTDSRVEVRLGADRRLLEVAQGRVQIDVGHDARPFLVHAGAATVRDIGTTFQVSRQAGEVRVGLIAGSVQVAVDDDRDAARTLVPGEQVIVDGDGRIGATRGLDVDAANGWTRGDLIFRERPLGELLAETNRYSATQLHLADPRLGDIRVSGVFHAGDQTALLKALDQGWGLRGEANDRHEIVLRRVAE